MENQPAEGVAVDGGWVLFSRVVGVDGSGLGVLLVASHVEKWRGALRVVCS